ncbi:hypothetical protein [Streptosporangium sp. NPDC087985]|uniref:hypothetical protein n=1 Tax=Streptosporangium sp. NPDC087985 TaxID=3366196 RepID=UPI0037FB5854
MKFADLVVGQLARIPRPIHLPDSPAVPPAVEILSTPQPCRLPTCEGWDVEARVLDTGEKRPYHRKPGFEVVLITPATPTTPTEEAS